MAAPVEIINHAASSWPIVAAAAATATAGLGGYLLAGRNDEARDRRTMAREIEVRKLERQQRLEDRAHDYQRDLLLDLQDELQRLVRATAKVIRFDQHSLETAGQISQLAPELNQESYDLGVSVRRLASRVLDDDLRAVVEHFHGQCGLTEAIHILHEGQPAQVILDALKEYLQDLTQEYMELSGHFGKVLREELGRTA